MENMISPGQVIAVLNQAHISFLLIGTYGLAALMGRARATEDVDVLVKSRQHRKAIRALLAAFTHLQAEDLPVVTRLRDKQSREVAIDVLKPVQPPYTKAFHYTQNVRVDGQPCKIPVPELALAMKLAAMLSQARDDVDRQQDSVDFRRIVKANPSIDLETAAKLGDLLCQDDGKEILEKIDQARTNQPFQI